ncbi:hypothetical protein MBLNU457_4627t2 [Dothideomycetes sp. NU457]
MAQTTLVTNGPEMRRLELDSTITPMEPQKRINEGTDIAFFLTSRAYVLLFTFLQQLNRAMFPVRYQDGSVKAWTITTFDIIQSPRVVRIRVLLQTIATMAKETTLNTAPRRFGNTSFRTFYEKLKDRTPELMLQAIPDNVWDHVSEGDKDTLVKELGAYLLGSFGSPERLDYGTGHELSFLAFVAAIWRLNGFGPSNGGNEERGIVVGIIDSYFEVIRFLIKRFSLEPAGSHGVWGLDDHSFIPYILGSAQLTPPIADGGNQVTEGSLANAPKPSMVAMENAVKILGRDNLYFGAVHFIYEVKKGPFWEHSPILFDISGIDKGWAKINQGLIKMYNAEVLSKFPVVQHLHFGSLFPWEQDPQAVRQQASIHARSQPQPLSTSTLRTATPTQYMPPAQFMPPPGSMPPPRSNPSNGSTPYPSSLARPLGPLNTAALPAGQVGAGPTPWSRKSAMSAPSTGLGESGSSSRPGASTPSMFRLPRRSPNES